MKKNKRLVIDTNVVVSALLFPDSSVGLAFSRGLLFGTILVSEETIQKLQEVLMRDKLDNAKAAFILTGDNDLLDLNPFRNIPILSPSEFLKIDSFKS